MKTKYQVQTGGKLYLAGVRGANTWLWAVISAIYQSLQKQPATR